jgi:AsmA protein
VIPIAALRTLDLEGQLAIGELKAFGLRSRAIRLPVAARGGRIRLGPSEAELYGGRYQGDVRVDARSPQPVFEFNERLAGIALGPFLRDADLYDKFEGTGDLELALTARGLTAREIKQTLNGRVAVRLRDGRIEGVNLEKLVTEARALYDRARGKEVRVVPAAGDETVFRSLTATARLTNGIAHNEDLVLAGPVVRAQGRGTADLVRETLDYRLEVTIAEGEGRRGTTVPVLIHGPFAQLEYRVALGEILQERLERKLEQKLERKLEKLFERK